VGGIKTVAVVQVQMNANGCVSSRSLKAEFFRNLLGLHGRLLRATPFVNLSCCFEAPSGGVGGNTEAAHLVWEPAFGVAA
jgi:hypothetical protein